MGQLKENYECEKSRADSYKIELDGVLLQQDRRGSASDSQGSVNAELTSFENTVCRHIPALEQDREALRLKVVSSLLYTSCNS